MLQFLIAHRIEKEQGSQEVSIRLGTRVFTGETEPASRLSDEIRSVFRRSSPSLGTFIKEDKTTGQYSQLLAGFRKEGESKKAFIEMTGNAVAALKDIMKGTPFATGGLVIFALYHHDQNRYLLAALVSETHVPWFDENMNLRENEAIDLKKLRHGVRVNLELLGRPSVNCVALLSSKGRDSAQYFERFVDFVKKEDPIAIANSIYEQTETFCEQMGYSPEQTSGVQERIYSYWRDCRDSGAPMTLQGVASAAMPDDPESILEFLSKEETGLPGDFQPPSDKMMRRFTRFSETEEGLTLAFARGRWASRVKVDESGGKRRIVIEDAPAQMIEKLKSSGLTTN